MPMLGDIHNRHENEDQSNVFRFLAQYNDLMAELRQAIEEENPLWIRDVEDRIRDLLGPEVDQYIDDQIYGDQEW